MALPILLSMLTTFIIIDATRMGSPRHYLYTDRQLRIDKAPFRRNQKSGAPSEAIPHTVWAALDKQLKAVFDADATDDESQVRTTTKNSRGSRVLHIGVVQHNRRPTGADGGAHQKVNGKGRREAALLLRSRTRGLDFVVPFTAPNEGSAGSPSDATIPDPFLLFRSLQRTTVPTPVIRRPLTVSPKKEVLVAPDVLPGEDN